MNGLTFDSRLLRLLTLSQKLSFVIMLLALGFAAVANWYFIYATVKVNQILLYPTYLLALDSLYMLASSRIIRKRISYFFNNNIDSISPLFTLESFYTASKSILGLWHFSYFIRIIYKTTTSISQLLFSPWIVDILRAFYEASRSLGVCVTEYQNFNNLLRRVNTYLPKSSP